MSSSFSLPGPNTVPISAAFNSNPNSSDNDDNNGIVSDHNVSVVILGVAVTHSPNQKHVSASVKSPVDSQQLSSVREYNSDSFQHSNSFNTSGIATSALLNSFSVPKPVFETEDCCTSLWKKRSYDRLNLHLAKRYCSLPLMSHSFRTSIFMSKDDFIAYLDEYVSRFNVHPRYRHHVDSAIYDEYEELWELKTIEYEYCSSEFLVIATEENSHAIIPKDLPGLETFTGKLFIHRESSSLVVEILVWKLPTALLTMERMHPLLLEAK
ncbi:hypothetical protein FF1_000067 [Malus domestica]